MTDRELLEYAAKAAGITCWIHCFGVPPYMGMRLNDGSIWNPLADDGDALRLTVKLNLHISVFVDAIGVGTPGAGYDEWKYNGDPYAATRRAIVEAAAEIGKAMP